MTVNTYNILILNKCAKGMKSDIRMFHFKIPENRGNSVDY